MGYIVPQCGPFTHVPQILFAPRDAFGRATGACILFKHSPPAGGTLAGGAQRRGCDATHPQQACDRAHLIAQSLGGNGSEPMNIVDTTPQANQSGMKTWENALKSFARHSDNNVILSVTPYYDFNDAESFNPIYIDMYAEEVFQHPQDVLINNERETVSGCRLFLKRVYNTPLVTSQNLPTSPRTYWCPGIPSYFHQ